MSNIAVWSELPHPTPELRPAESWSVVLQEEDLKHIVAHRESAKKCYENRGHVCRPREPWQDVLPAQLMSALRAVCEGLTPFPSLPHAVRQQFAGVIESEVRTAFEASLVLGYFAHRSEGARGRSLARPQRQWTPQCLVLLPSGMTMVLAAMDHGARYRAITCYFHEVVCGVNAADRLREMMRFVVRQRYLVCQSPGGEQPFDPQVEVVIGEGTAQRGQRQWGLACFSTEAWGFRQIGDRWRWKAAWTVAARGVVRRESGGDQSRSRLVPRTQKP